MLEQRIVCYRERKDKTKAFGEFSFLSISRSNSASRAKWYPEVGYSKHSYITARLVEEFGRRKKPKTGPRGCLLSLRISCVMSEDSDPGKESRL